MFLSKKKFVPKKIFTKRKRKFISYQRNIVWKNFLCKNNLKKKYIFLEENCVNKKLVGQLLLRKYLTILFYFTSEIRSCNFTTNQIALYIFHTRILSSNFDLGDMMFLRVPISNRYKYHR